MSEEQTELYHISFYNCDGEADGYFARVTAREAAVLRIYLDAKAHHGDWSNVCVEKLDRVPYYKDLLFSLRERLTDYAPMLRYSRPSTRPLRLRGTDEDRERRGGVD